MDNDILTDETGQLSLPLLHADTHVTTSDGIEMGVLENGMPYLSQRGLTTMAGIPRTTFQRLSDNWKEKKTSNDEVAAGINKLLEQTGYFEKELFIEIEEDKKRVYAYTEPVCLAILEYYAFDAKKKSEIAQNSFRTLSKAGFRLFVYQITGYKPLHTQLDSWKHFHDRIDLVYDKVPSGYFCIFREIAGMVVTLIRKNIIVNDKIIPDISVGQHWARYWKEGVLNDEFGGRIDYEHNYPDYYPQADSNPQPAKAYPNESLHIFRKWFEETYLLTKFPKYMLTKSRQGKIDLDIATKAIKSVTMPQIEQGITTTLDPHLKKALDYNPKTR